MRKYLSNNWCYLTKQNLYADLYSKQRRISILHRRELYKPINKKVYTSLTFYPTDYRKKNLTSEKLLCNFFMRGGRFFKVLANLRRAQAIFINSMIYEAPVFLKKKYSFYETLGQIIYFNSSQ